MGVVGDQVEIDGVTLVRQPTRHDARSFGFEDVVACSEVEADWFWIDWNNRRGRITEAAMNGCCAPRPFG